MKLYWGAYEFGDNEVQIGTNAKNVYSPAGLRIHKQNQMTVRGVKQASSASALTTALAALEAAVDDEPRDLIFKDNSGSNTVHAFTTSGTLNGIRAVAPVRYLIGYPGVWGSRTEYVHMRTYEITFQWETADADSNLAAYTEEIIVIADGSADFIIQEALSGTPQAQTVAAQTGQAFKQVGMALGYTSYPSFPSFAYSSSYFKPKKSYIAKGTPRKWGSNTNTMFPIRWSYHFEIPSGATLATPATPTF